MLSPAWSKRWDICLFKTYMYVVSLLCGSLIFLQFIMLWSKDETVLWLLRNSFICRETFSFPRYFKEVSAIINKLKKLRVKYKTDKGKLKKSGTSRPKKQWKFFEKMDAIYKENPSIQPPYVVDSSKKSGESDLSEESESDLSEESEKFSLPWQKSTVKSRRFKLIVLVVGKVAFHNSLSHLSCNPLVFMFP